MGKCENMARLKALHGERVHQSVTEAAERGRREHAAFERQGDSRCFVASWALGPEHWATEELRRFRDRALARSRPGRAFIAFYYHSSPVLVRGLSRLPGAKGLSAVVLRGLARAMKLARRKREDSSWRR